MGWVGVRGMRKRPDGPQTGPRGEQKGLSPSWQEVELLLQGQIHKGVGRGGKTSSLVILPHSSRCVPRAPVKGQAASQVLDRAGDQADGGWMGSSWSSHECHPLRMDFEQASPLPSPPLFLPPSWELSGFWCELLGEGRVWVILTLSSAKTGFLPPEHAQGHVRSQAPRHTCPILQLHRKNYLSVFFSSQFHLRQL